MQARRRYRPLVDLKTQNVTLASLGTMNEAEKGWRLRLLCRGVGKGPAQQTVASPPSILLGCAVPTVGVAKYFYVDAPLTLPY
jgi:hypothetical protein